MTVCPWCLAAHDSRWLCDEARLVLDAAERALLRVQARMAAEAVPITEDENP